VALQTNSLKSKKMIEEKLEKARGHGDWKTGVEEKIWESGLTEAAGEVGTILSIETSAFSCLN
jgi:hypothetical protein